MRVMCMRSPLALMGGFSPAAVSMESFAYGKGKRRWALPPGLKSSWYRPVGYRAWLLLPTGELWPARTGIRRSNSGRWQADNCFARFQDIWTSRGALLGLPMG